MHSPIPVASLASPALRKIHLLSTLYIFSICLLLSISVSMNGLPVGVHPDLPRQEFILKLVHLPTKDLLPLRLALFNEASTVHGLVPSDFSTIPLVARRDTAIKSASMKLGEDIWTIVSCISNLEPIPRTLFRNGKRSKQYLSHTTTTTKSNYCPSVSATNQSLQLSTNSVPSSNNCDTNTNITTTVNPPSSSNVSTYFISRELNSLKDDVRSMKSDISAMVRGHNCTGCPSTSVLGEEIVSLKRDLASLRDIVSSTYKNTNPQFADQLPTTSQHM